MDTTQGDTLKKNRDTTRAWSTGIILTILVQTVTFIWFAATKITTLENQTRQNSEDIAILKSGLPPLTRENVQDLLLVRDTRIDNIEKSLNRVEVKLDNVLGYK